MSERLPPTPYEEIVQWFMTHPESAVRLAVDAVALLYLDEGGWLPHDEPFGSAADYIDNITRSMVACGAWPGLIEPRTTTPDNVIQFPTPTTTPEDS